MPEAAERALRSLYTPPVPTLLCLRPALPSSYPPAHLSTDDLQRRMDALKHVHHPVIDASYETSNLMHPCWHAAVRQAQDSHPFPDPRPNSGTHGTMTPGVYAHDFPLYPSV